MREIMCWNVDEAETSKTRLKIPTRVQLNMPEVTQLQWSDSAQPTPKSKDVHFRVFIQLPTDKSPSMAMFYKRISIALN